MLVLFSQVAVAQQASLVVIHSFNPYPRGARPVAALAQGAGGVFYATTSEGGARNLGTIFKIDSAGVLTTIHPFTGGDGNGFASLTPAEDGSFYGTTAGGGANGYGTIFKLVDESKRA